MRAALRCSEVWGVLVPTGLVALSGTSLAGSLVHDVYEVETVGRGRTLGYRRPFDKELGR